MTKRLKSDRPFTTEAGDILPAVEIAYNTWGELNEDADNVIWICHAFTSGSDVETWWPGMVGEGLLFDTDRFFVVCANILGSCYGSTGPSSINPAMGKQWLLDFPLITFRDLVAAHEILRKHLGIKHIHTIIGASIGANQSMEYCIMHPDLIGRMVFISSNIKQSPWAIAFNEAQRLALKADASFTGDDPEGGREGMKAARAIALLSYRSDVTYNETQAEDDDEKITSFKASSYQAYQGDKLVKRFNPFSYWYLTCLADTHNIGRGRGGAVNALKMIKARVLCIGVRSDILYPVREQQYVASATDNAEYVEIDSLYGHDGFLIESDTVTSVVKKFLNDSTD